MQENLEKVDEIIARGLLEIKAIKIQPKNPFKWASGWRSPMYANNRKTLFHPFLRGVIKKALCDLINSLVIDNIVIAGTATAGMPIAAMVADYLDVSYVYVRSKAKDHGTSSLIEGIDTNDDLKGKEVIVFDDLFSTGKSAAVVVQTIRNAGGIVNHCCSIFSYGFSEVEQVFSGQIAFNENGDKLTLPCSTHSLLMYPKLLEVALTVMVKEEGKDEEQPYISAEDQDTLLYWSSDPEGWSNAWKEAHPEPEKV